MCKAEAGIRVFLVELILLILSSGAASATDIWDQASTNDDTSANTRNVLLPGDIQRHDVQAKAGPTADQDWYRLVAVEGHSYEVRVGARQDFCFDFVGNKFEILESNAMTQRTTGVDILGAGQISSYRAVFTAPTSDTIFVHLTGETTCTATSEYTIQLFETTLFGPLYFNGADFDSFITLQNTTAQTINATLTLTDIGNFASFVFNTSVPPNGGTVLSARAVVGCTTTCPSTLGSIRISHDKEFGALNGFVTISSPSSSIPFSESLRTRDQ